jgi:superfamily II DNA or RNA helicase
MTDFKRRRQSPAQTASLESPYGAVLGAGCRVQISSLQPGTVRAAQQALTFFPSSTYDRSASPPGPVQSYRVEEDGTLVVPRCYGARVFKADDSGLSDGCPSECVFTGTLLDRQVKATNACIDQLRAMPHAAMLVLPCGFGKTVVGIAVAASLGRKWMVVVHKEFLLEQWKDRLARFLPSARVGIVQGVKCEVDNVDVVIAMLQSLVSRDYGEHAFDSIGTMVLDEAHHLAARLFSEVFFRIPARHVLGLTATPKRKDSCTALLHEHMGTFAYREEADPGAASVATVTYRSPWQARSDMELVPPEAQRLRTKMTRDLKRNELIIAWCLRSAQCGRRTIILSDRVQHLHDLLSLFRAEKGEGSSAVYIGGLKRSQRELAADAQTMFATFSIASEGLDIPQLDTLLLATPACDVTQAVGRILRECPDKMSPVIIDIQDDPCKNFQRLNIVRETLYRKRGFDVHVSCTGDYSILS